MESGLSPTIQKVSLWTISMIQALLYCCEDNATAIIIPFGSWGKETVFRYWVWPSKLWEALRLTKSLDRGNNLI